MPSITTGAAHCLPCASVLTSPPVAVVEAEGTRGVTCGHGRGRRRRRGPLAALRRDGVVAEAADGRRDVDAHCLERLPKHEDRAGMGWGRGRGATTCSTRGAAYPRRPAALRSAVRAQSKPSAMRSPGGSSPAPPAPSIARPRLEPLAEWVALSGTSRAASALSSAPPIPPKASAVPETTARPGVDRAEERGAEAGRPPGPAPPLPAAGARRRSSRSGPCDAMSTVPTAAAAVSRDLVAASEAARRRAGRSASTRRDGCGRGAGRRLGCGYADRRRAA